MMRATGELLKDMYRIAHVQVALDRDELSLEIDWQDLRERFEGALIREGIVLPELPDTSRKEQG